MWRRPPAVCKLAEPAQQAVTEAFCALIGDAALQVRFAEAVVLGRQRAALPDTEKDSEPAEALQRAASYHAAEVEKALEASPVLTSWMAEEYRTDAMERPRVAVLGVDAWERAREEFMRAGVPSEMYEVCLSLRLSS